MMCSYGGEPVVVEHILIGGVEHGDDVKDPLSHLWYQGPHQTAIPGPREMEVLASEGGGAHGGI